MKKILKFLLYFILFVLIVLIITPIAFKGKILEIANKQANDNLNAEVVIDDVSISMFRKFPFLSVGLDNILITGVDDFENDTLIYFNRFELVANPWTAIGKKNITVQKIILLDPVINAIVLEDGKANWDIAPEPEESDEEIEPVTEESVEEDTTAGGLDQAIELKLFKIQNANISYTDKSSNMAASLKNFNIEITGNFVKDFTQALILSTCEAVNLSMDGIGYLTDVALDIKFDVDAHMDKNMFILRENHVALNELTLKWDGSVEMPDTNEIKFDLKYATSNTSFKTLLSLVPAIYTEDFSDLQTEGNLLLEGAVNGSMIGDYLPDVKGKLVVSDAMFKYPDLPKSVNNINIDIKYNVDGKQMDNTTVDIDKFHVELGTNPVDINMNLRTPISDPYINGSINANLDLNSLNDVVPLENTTIAGLIDINLDMMGNMSVIEEEKYEEFKADGKIAISNLEYASADIPYATKLPKANISFSPKFVSIDNLEAIVGKSDFALSGKVSNFLPYVFNDATLKGNLSIASNNIDLNEFMGSDEEGAESDDTPEAIVDSTKATTPEESGESEVAVIPDNIDFSLLANFKHLLYDKMDINNFVGKIYIKDGKAVMEEISMNTLGGSLELAGEYNTIDKKNPLVDFSFDAKGIDITQTSSSLSVVEKIAPIATRSTGKISLGLKYTSFLNSKMSPVLQSIIGEGNLSSEKIGVKESPALTSLGKELKTEEFKELVLKNIDLLFEIRGGKLMVKPFETKIGKSDLLISGNQTFDNVLDYDINLNIPSEVLGSNNWGSSVQSLAGDKGINISGPEKLNVAAKVTGPMTNPKVSLDFKKTMGAGTKAIKEEMKKTAQEAIDKTKEEAKQKAKAEADKIMKEAQQRADKVKQEGKIAADKVRKEADINADRIMKEAKNPLAKVAAEKAADKVRKEGDKKAKSLEWEANNKADAIMKNAQEKADKLMK
ncbi:MAG: hypothetical protein MI922_30560 [Bacteroidales bacterium]|nr:hypothetical protein [Bacteroidales bacterium]